MSNSLFQLKRQNIIFWVPLLLAFFIPLYKKAVPPIIILWIIIWIFNGSYKNIYKYIGSLTFLILPVFYLIHAIFLINTRYSNLSVGLFDIQVKLSLLIIPFLFINTKTYSYKNIIYFFIAGVFTGSLFCIGNAIYNSGFSNMTWFFYTKLSFIHHPTYFAMFVSMASIFIYYELKNKISISLKVCYILILIWFCVFIFLLSSKAGIIAGFSAFLILVFYDLFKGKNIFLYSILILITASSFCFALKNNNRFASVNTALERSKNNVSTNESSAVRLLVWSSTINILKTDWLFGVGTGDIKEELCKEYKKNDYESALKERLNVHNQFLETFLGQGIVGLIWILLLFFYPLKIFWKNKDLVALLFLFICAINFLFESMLNNQAGVVFFAFFYSFFIFININKPANTE